MKLNCSKFVFWFQTIFLMEFAKSKIATIRRNIKEIITHSLTHSLRIGVVRLKRQLLSFNNFLSLYVQCSYSVKTDSKPLAFNHQCGSKKCNKNFRYVFFMNASTVCFVCCTVIYVLLDFMLRHLNVIISCTLKTVSPRKKPIFISLSKSVMKFSFDISS